MKLTKSTQQGKLEINQPVDPCSSQTYFFQLFSLNIEYPGACQKQWHTAFKGHEKGWTRVRRSKDNHWLIWGQLPKVDRQGSCCQDVWQAPDEPHQLMTVMSGTPRCTQYILGQMVYEINFKFNKDFKGIELILFHKVWSVLDKLNKTNEDKLQV